MTEKTACESSRVQEFGGDGLTTIWVLAGEKDNGLKKFWTMGGLRVGRKWGSQWHVFKQEERSWKREWRFCGGETGQL